MGKAIYALTGCAARHENTPKYFWRQHFGTKNPLWEFLLLINYFQYTLRELGSYILRDTPKP